MTFFLADLRDHVMLDVGAWRERLQELRLVMFQCDLKYFLLLHIVSSTNLFCYFQIITIIMAKPVIIEITYSDTETGTEDGLDSGDENPEAAADQRTGN